MVISKEDVYKLKYGDIVRCIEINMETGRHSAKDILIDYVENCYLYGNVYNRTTHEYDYIRTNIDNYYMFYKIDGGLSIHTVDEDIDQFGILLPTIDYLCCEKTNYPLIKVSIGNVYGMENFINIITKKTVNLNFYYDNVKSSYKNVSCIQKDMITSSYDSWHTYILTFRIPWEEHQTADDFQSKMKNWLV